MSDYKQLGAYSGPGNLGVRSKGSGLTRIGGLDTDAVPASSDNTENEEFADRDTKTLDVNEETSSDKWLARAQDAFRSSTSYVDTNYRASWENSLDLFNSIHPSGSKYHNPLYDKRSKIFRPKIRAIIRKTEASGAAAFFSNQDIVDIQAQNQTNKQQAAGAAIMKELLQFRLKKNVKWFQTVLGALQDAQVTGVCCAHVYWKHESKEVEHEVQVSKALPDLSPNNELTGFQGENLTSPSTVNKQNALSEIDNSEEFETRIEITKEVLIDEPCIDLIPIDRLRIDPAASWIDPVNSSPYVIEIIPMYVCDVKHKMKAGEWEVYSEETIMSAVGDTSGSLSYMRNKGKQNPYESGGKGINDYATVWVHRHIHRDDTDDFEFYTLADKCMLTQPRPLSESVFHGKRPYVIGNCNVETHKTFASSIPEMAQGLQEEANEIVNQRLDNVKFVLNKRYVVKRNKQVDVAALLKNVPGGVIAVDALDDIREISYPDVTTSAYQEQDRINGDMDELLGNFSAQSVSANRAVGETAHGMALMNSSANVLIEYLLRTFTETFMEPVLRLMILLEQHYETDETVIAIAGQRAQAFEKFGVSEQLDKLLNNEFSLNVNVGMGATDPTAKINKLATGLNTLKNLIGPNFNSMLDIDEVSKEVFGALGYADGSRFVKQGSNPQLMEAQKLIQQLQAQLKSKQEDHQVKHAIAKDNNQTKLAIAGVKETSHNQRFLVGHYMDKTFTSAQASAKLAQDQSLKPAQIQKAQEPQQPLPPRQ